MSDTTINRFVSSGTAAQRVAFTPAPATPASGPSPLCIWYETDTGDTYMSANAGSWVLLTGNALNVLPWKRPCRAKTTGALAANTYANGTAGVGATLTGNANGALAAQDGITLVAGESLLVANEAAGLGNGIYTVTQVGTGGTPYILTRRNDATSGAGLVNATTKVSEGTVAADLEYQCTTNSAITVGTTAQVWAQAGGSFTAASTTEQLTGTDAAKGSTPDSVASLWEQGVDVASAGTTSLAEGGYFFITGTTTITDIDFATDKAGRTAWVKFAGILTLTHNASTLILPTGANITTAAGDTACFISEGTDIIRCVAYMRASGAALSSTAGSLTLITETVTSATQASVTFSSIVATYRDLVVVVRGRGTTAAATASVLLQFNADTTANYDSEDAHWFGAATSFAQTLAGTSIFAGYIAAGTATANYSGGVNSEIYDYRGTTFTKQVSSRNGTCLGTGAGNIGGAVASGQWRSTSAITAVKVLLDAGNFVDNSVVSLYGRM